MKIRALTMLAASLAMVLETACSHAPAPTTRPAEAPKKIITKIYTTDSTMYVTSSYAVTDSFVVINDVLRDKKFYPDPEKPHLYNHPDPVNQPPSSIDLPVKLRMDQVKKMELWEESHATRNGALIGAGLFAFLFVGVLVLLATMDPIQFSD